MLIIDSLLNFNFFLSGEVQENLSLLSASSSAHHNGTGSCLQQAQLGAVIRAIRAEHGEESMQQFSHDRHYCLQGCLPGSPESRKESSRVGLMAYGNQRRHVQRPPQMTTSPSANARFLVDRGARRKTNGV